MRSAAKSIATFPDEFFQHTMTSLIIQFTNQMAADVKDYYTLSTLVVITEVGLQMDLWCLAKRQLEKDLNQQVSGQLQTLPIAWVCQSSHESKG